MSMDLGRIASITNITSEDFVHAYNGTPFTIKASETLVLPYDLARHLAKHLARKIIFSDAKPSELRNDRSLVTKESEVELIGKIISDPSNKPVPVELSKDEILKKRVEELNEDKPEEVTSDRVKADVIKEMDSLKLPVDKRKSKESLEEELAKAKGEIKEIL